MSKTVTTEQIERLMLAFDDVDEVYVARRGDRVYVGRVPVGKVEGSDDEPPPSTKITCGEDGSWDVSAIVATLNS